MSKRSKANEAIQKKKDGIRPPPAAAAPRGLARIGLDPKVLASIVKPNRLRTILVVVVAIGVVGGLSFLAFSDHFWTPKRKTFDPSLDEKKPLKINAFQPPGPSPEGMVWIPGGEFWMGVDPDDYPDIHPEFFADAWPVHKVYVDGFWMDKTELTNEAFAGFVKTTGYVTVAEKDPDPKEFPGVPRDKLKPFSIAFQQPGPEDRVDLRNHEGWMKLAYGASWKHPEGPGSDLKNREKHPVVHICYEDALAYCKWAKKRLPTEAEWEFAARGGLHRKKYCWGDELTPDGKWQCNNWQGRFPQKNDLLDGHFGTAAVGSYPGNPYGLHDMAGNVWEWCSDWYRPDYYKDSSEHNPQGPASGFDPREQGVGKRVQRGGSYLCADNYCIRYLPGARGKGEPTSAASHVGFRCVKNAR
jgi:formylglycine-generating enzyme required for sulfatase activity